MIAIVFYAILAGLIVIAAFISNRLIKIFGWSLSPNKFFLLHAGVFVGILCILFFDHIIGAIQFEYICHRKVMVKLEPDWINVRRAKFEMKRTRLRGYIVQTSCSDGKYLDADSGKIILSYTRCSRAGGILLRTISFNGDSGGSYCNPKELPDILHATNIEALLEKGDSQ